MSEERISEERATTIQHPPQQMRQGHSVEAEARNFMKNLRRISWITGIAAVFVASLHLMLYFSGAGEWQSLAFAGSMMLALLVFLLPAHRLARRGRFTASGYLLVLGLAFAYGCSELFFAGLSLYHMVGGILLIGLVGSILLPRKWGAWLVTGAIFGVCVWLINRYEPLPRYDATRLPVLRIDALGVTVLLGLAILGQMVRALHIGTIRARLLIAFVLIALLPATAISAGSLVLGYQGGQRQVINQLESVATLKHSEIETWVSTLRSDLAAALSGEDAARRTIVLLQAPEPSDYLLSWVRNRLQQAVEQSGHFDEMFLMDLQGKVILSTDVKQEGKIHSNQPYFQRGLQESYVQPPFYSPSLGRWSVVAVRPVVDKPGQVWGILAGRASMAKLNEIMLERSGLGQTGETYLVGRNRALLTESRFGQKGIYVHTQGANAAIENQVNGSGLYDNYRGVPIVGVYHWVPDLQVALLAEQNQSEAFSAIYRTMGLNIGVALVSVVLAVLASLFAARSIAIPLANLTETATQIAAGDLERVAKVEREDEVGTLAQAFNSMTIQLRELIGSLEQRVAERTRELERHSAYLEASAEVGRAATSILETDRLIQQVVELIRERFDLYYVGLFLLDESGEWAVLQAGTGEAGQAMLARGHRIKVGEGMIGWSIANARARVASEVSEDVVHLATVEVPETRSEAALPLRSRGQVLGALTVQSTQPDVFDQDTIIVLQTMADQVAVALDNARLFAESQAALEATRRAYGELSRQAWIELLRAQPNLGYRSDEHGVTGAGDIWRPEMEQALQKGQTVQISDSQSHPPNPLAVPIKVRGEVIGVLDTYKPDGAGRWTSEEIALLEALADQLGMALESARLYEDAQRRAAREQLTREITDKMRRAAGVEGIVRTAVDELSRVLGTSRTFVRLRVASPPKGDGKEKE